MGSLGHSWSTFNYRVACRNQRVSTEPFFPIEPPNVHPQAPIFISKVTVERSDTHALSDGSVIRLGVAAENPVHPPNVRLDPPGLVRIKRRCSFNYKDEMLYELTEVRSGDSEEAAARANPDFEVRHEGGGAAVDVCTGYINRL